MSRRSIVIIGPPGSGKTTVGNILAARLDCPFLDTDSLIEKQTGQSVSDIFASAGEPAFRQLETQTLKNLASFECPAGRFVLSTGGGIGVAQGNFELLAALGTVVGLTAAANTLASRLHEDASRPLLAAAGNSDLESRSKRLQQLLTDRKDVYAKADHTVETASLAPEEVADRIESILELVDREQI